MADYPALYVARIMAARELSNSTRGKASTLDRQLKAEEIDKRAAELLANKNFRSFADLTNRDKACADKVKEIFSKKHSHGGELDDMFRSYLRTLPAGELRNDAELKRWMPTVKERVESLQEQAQKSLKAGREVYREATEIMLLRTMVGAKRGGEGLDRRIPVRDGNKDIPSVSDNVVKNADAREVREAFDKANGAKYICSGHGGKMIENIAKASGKPVDLETEADVPVKTKTAGEPERGSMLG